MRTTLTNGFWLGVQLFFVISGYCIAAAVDNSKDQELTFLQFMRRRVRRIAPPYLGSLAVAAVVKLATSGDFSNASRSISLPWFWLSNCTLTQWSYLTTRWVETGDGFAVPWFNPILLLGVHWSLNYEEQFYLLCGLILVFHRKVRTVMLVAVLTAGVAFFNMLWPGRITGLFVDYWLQFFCGVLVYLRLCRSRSNGMARALDALLLGGALVLLICALWRGDFPLLPRQFQFHGQLAVCAVYALLLIALRRYDEAASASLPVRALGFFGKFSYSIYLVHLPMLDALEPVSQSLQSRLGWAAADLWIIGAVLVSAYGFHRVFEKPFINPSLASGVQWRRRPAVLSLR
jgi:peptidoglycan/LPS O-acetylase OafA/YrhL